MNKRANSRKSKKRRAQSRSYKEGRIYFCGVCLNYYKYTRDTGVLKAMWREQLGEGSAQQRTCNDCRRRHA